MFIMSYILQHLIALNSYNSPIMPNIFLCLHFKWGNQVIKKSLPDPPLELSFLDQITQPLSHNCVVIIRQVFLSLFLTDPGTCISFHHFLHSCDAPQLWMHTFPKRCNNRTQWRSHWMVWIWARNSSHSQRVKCLPEQEGHIRKHSVVYHKSKSQRLSWNKETRQQVIEKKGKTFLEMEHISRRLEHIFSANPMQYQTTLQKKFLTLYLTYFSGRKQIIGCHLSQILGVCMIFYNQQCAGIAGPSTHSHSDALKQKEEKQEVQFGQQKSSELSMIQPIFSK